ncbi:TetR/AcrR family transcriptional regulator [Vitreoscilla massiliensis]|uniref:TetR/AcrR family transcriptional regulator n=1 Tax=Vitreoscilla massiliensis TaxID=1689272 RepID=A0ABY4E0U4_9NEIS|nr:TetR/AcrR family transcriptional regulator [Vitreoscilla massiliensis]UOO88971.1 TetR/AcrR family transcriptional regulator [Vitreoscilla massiliensis]
MATTYKRSTMMQARMEQNRHTIFQAARSLIAAGGFKEAQMVTIAEAAGVSTGLIYRYFSNKTQLMVEILTDAVSNEIIILHAIAQRPESAQDNLHAAVTAFVRRALTGPQLAYAFMAEPVDPQVEAERILCKQRFANVFKDILNTGVANQEFEIEDVETAAACVVGAMTEAVISPIAPTTPTTHDKHRVATTIADFCVRAVCK